MITRKVEIVIEAISLTAPKVEFGAREDSDRKVGGVILVLAQEIPVLGKKQGVRSVSMAVAVTRNGHNDGWINIRNSLKQLTVKFSIVTSGRNTATAATGGPRATGGSRLFYDVDLAGVRTEITAGDFSDVVWSQNLPEQEELLHPVGILFSMENSNALRVRTDLDVQTIKINH